MISKYLLSSKLALVCLTALLLLLGNTKYQQWKKEAAIEDEKKRLTEQQDQLMKKNKEFSDSLQYLTSDDFRDRAARQQLNLKKNGEIVYNFTVAAATATPLAVADTETASNPAKWWKYFFGSQ